jgi:hypothetical protein
MATPLILDGDAGHCRFRIGDGAVPEPRRRSGVMPLPIGPTLRRSRMR